MLNLQGNQLRALALWQLRALQTLNLQGNQSLRHRSCTAQVTAAQLPEAPGLPALGPRGTRSKRGAVGGRVESPE